MKLKNLISLLENEAEQQALAQQDMPIIQQIKQFLSQIKDEGSFSMIIEETKKSQELYKAKIKTAMQQQAGVQSVVNQK